MFEEQEEERIEVDMDDNNDFERTGSYEEESSDITQPVEIIEEEVVTVSEKPILPEISLVSSPVASSEDGEENDGEEEEEEENDGEEEEGEIRIDNSGGDNKEISDKVKAQSIQIGRLVDVVESLQAQVKQLQETTRLRRRRNTSSVRARSGNNRMKTKKEKKNQKKTTRRRRTRGSKNK